MTTYGYHACYLRVDLTSQTAERISIPPSVLRKFIGGAGLATWLLSREAPPNADPFSPESPIVFCLSPLVGTPLTTSAKFAVVAKSPLTQRLNDSLSSSHFALSAKKAGFDALVVIGRCSSPSMLVIDEENVRVEGAGDLWGESASVAAERFRRDHGPRFHTALIGRAGEKLVRYATISHDSRHAGRGGLGAVLGAKKLKGVAVAGSKRVPVAHPERVVEAARDLSKKSFGPATAKYRELGTVANLLTLNRFAALPTRNFQQGSFADADSLSGEKLNETRRMTRASCAACTIGCEHIYKASTGTVRLEYESLFALGPLCGVSDKDAVLQAARLCDDYGLDTISTGATIAFAMECAERGMIDDGELRFGSAEKMLALVTQIGERDGLGDLLADGSRIVAEHIGGDASDFAPHVKGLEIPGYEPRALQTMALGFAVGSRGADHNRSGAYEVDFSSKVDRLNGSPDSAVFAVDTENRAALMDSLIFCKFLRGVFDDFFRESADLLSLVTGWDVTADELRTTAERIIVAKKLFNIREGWTAAEDTLPKRFLSQGLPGDNDVDARLPRERLQSMVAAYYRERGWTENGMPPTERVRELGLEEFGGLAGSSDVTVRPTST